MGGGIDFDSYTDKQLYLLLPGSEGRVFDRVQALIGVFAGERGGSPVWLVTRDAEGRRLKAAGGRCELNSVMLDCLRELLGSENVAMKQIEN